MNFKKDSILYRNYDLYTQAIFKWNLWEYKIPYIQGDEDFVHISFTWEWRTSQDLSFKKILYSVEYVYIPHR